MKPVAAVILLCCLPAYVESANGTEAKALRTKIFDTDGYDKKIRPADNQSDATGTRTSFNFIKLPWS